MAIATMDPLMTDDAVRVRDECDLSTHSLGRDD